MMNQGAARAKCHAVGAPLERRVGPREGSGAGALPDKADQQALAAWLRGTTTRWRDASGRENPAFASLPKRAAFHRMAPAPEEPANAERRERLRLAAPPVQPSGKKRQCVLVLGQSRPSGRFQGGLLQLLASGFADSVTHGLGCGRSGAL
jgi:hypothetical protein